MTEFAQPRQHVGRIAIPILLTIGVLGAAVPIVSFATRSKSPRVVVMSARALHEPTIDGEIDAVEWHRAAAIPIEFALDEHAVHGMLRSLWTPSRLSLGIELYDAGITNLTVALNARGDGTLTEDDLAYTVWMSGATERMHYEGGRNVFVADGATAARDETIATRRSETTQMFEFSIPADKTNDGALTRELGGRPMKLALRIERTMPMKSADTWPTSAARDALTASPNQWAILDFEYAVTNPSVHAASPTYVPPPTPRVTVEFPQTQTAKPANTGWRVSVPATPTPTPLSPQLRTAPIPSPTPAAPPPPPSSPSSLTTLGLSAAFVGNGNPSDRFTSAAAAQHGTLHLGTGTVGAIGNEPYTFTPAMPDAIALVWAGIRHGINPNYLAAVGIQASHYSCMQHANGCFQIEPAAFRELVRQFPQTFRTTGYSTAVRSSALAPQTAAFHYQLVEALFRRWYNWDAFHERANDRWSRLKLLTRAYNRGAWDLTIGHILVTNRERCAAQPDIVSCYDAQTAARDHTEAVVQATDALSHAPPYDAVISWTSLHAFLLDGVAPYVTNIATWNVIVEGARTRYQALERAHGQFTFARSLPLLLTWVSNQLPTLESPQHVNEYIAPIR